MGKQYFPSLLTQERGSEVEFDQPNVYDPDQADCEGKSVVDTRKLEVLIFRFNHTTLVP